jgi:hypothetical protein
MMNNANESQSKSEMKTPDCDFWLHPLSLLMRSSFLSRDGELALGRIPGGTGVEDVSSVNELL